jgi:hypothetical protein
MIIFKKLPDGTWEKSGEILPTETHYRIAVDAENPEAIVYLAADAVREVEARIAKLDCPNYRYELAMPPASLLKKAREESEKIIHRILRGSSKAAKVRKPKAKKKESGKQRRARLKREGLCTACGKNKARKGKCECRECAEYYNGWAAKARKA